VPRVEPAFIKLALSPRQASLALNLGVERINQAVREGNLLMRVIGQKHLIPIGGRGGLQEWLESQPIYEPKKPRSRVTGEERKRPHADHH
jgi:hypothetical protein